MHSVLTVEKMDPYIDIYMVIYKPRFHSAFLSATGLGFSSLIVSPIELSSAPHVTYSSPAELSEFNKRYICILKWYIGHHTMLVV